MLESPICESWTALVVEALEVEGIAGRKAWNAQHAEENRDICLPLFVCALLLSYIACHPILSNSWHIFYFMGNIFQEVARIEMQAAANAGEASRSMLKVMSGIVTTEGPAGLFKGVVPRILLGIWQTLFMVTGAKLLKGFLADGK